MSATELANAQRYWQGIWRAGGIEDDERAAWRSLVAAHGSSRAGYIVVTYRPTRPLAAAKPGEYRKVEVASRRVGLYLRSRKGYVVPNNQ